VSDTNDPQLDESDADDVDDGDRLSEESLRTGSSKLPVILLVVAALVAVFFIGKATSGGDDSGDDGAEGGSATTVAGGGEVPFPSGDQNRTGYWGFADLEPTVVDTFDRANAPDGLGTTGTGQAWEVVSGTWGIQGNAAATSGGATGDQPNIAVVPEGTGDGLTEIYLPVVEEGAGLVFRYLDPDNYWSVTANPGVGSWTLNRVIDGDVELVQEIPGPTNDGIVVSVTQDGSVVRVLLDGVEYLSITDAALGDQLQGGIIASSSTSGDARFDRFLVMRFRDQAAGGGEGEGGGSTTTTAAG
jgi:hypothetical protein